MDRASSSRGKLGLIERHREERPLVLASFGQKRSRRQFLGVATKTAVILTAGLGRLVGFSPAMAAGTFQCDASPPINASGICDFSCSSPCSKKGPVCCLCAPTALCCCQCVAKVCVAEARAIAVVTPDGAFCCCKYCLP